MKIFILFLSFLMLFTGCSNRETEIIEEISQESSYEESSENSSITDSESSEELPSKPEEDEIYINGWTAGFKPSDFETLDEYYDTFLAEWVKNLEPIEIFETETEFPFVIKEIFEILTERDDFNTVVEVTDLIVRGDENKFYASIQYSTENRVDGIVYDNWLMIRVHKMDDGRYALMTIGGGPCDYGLRTRILHLKMFGNQNDKRRLNEPPFSFLFSPNRAISVSYLGLPARSGRQRI